MTDSEMTPKISDFRTCYRELLEGVSIEKLSQKYVRVEVCAAQGLVEKQVPLAELVAFQDRRARQLEAKAGLALECACGLTLFDETEYHAHVRLLSPESRQDHELTRGPTTRRVKG